MSLDKTRLAEVEKLKAERQKLEEEAKKIQEAMKQIQQAKLEAEKIKQEALDQASTLKEKCFGLYPWILEACWLANNFRIAS